MLQMLISTERTPVHGITAGAESANASIRLADEGKLPVSIFPVDSRRKTMRLSLTAQDVPDGNAS